MSDLKTFNQHNPSSDFSPHHESIDEIMTENDPEYEGLDLSMPSAASFRVRAKKRHEKLELLSENREMKKHLFDY